MTLRKEQIFRYRKYLTLNLPHLTPRKLANMLRVEWRLRRGNPDMRGCHPYILFVDLHATCNLRCPLCVMGKREVRQREPLMDYERYRTVMEPLRDYLYQVFLYNNAEPFLNPAVYDIIAWNRRANIGTTVSSNLSLDIDPVRLVASGLEYLVVSADGLTQKVYEQYRVGGNLGKVTGNLEAVIAEKKRRGTTTPFIEWQCLVTKKNEHQLGDIREYAYSLGVDVVRFANINFFSVHGRQAEMEREWLPVNPDYRAFETPGAATTATHRKPCYWLWRTAIISANGGVLPCCLYDTEDWGNVFEQPLADIWNNERYRKARRLSMPGEHDGPPIVCDTCRAPFIR